MKVITYRELLERLQRASAQQLDQEVTVYSQVLDEFTSVVVVHQAGTPAGCHADDILDSGHLFLEYDG